MLASLLLRELIWHLKLKRFWRQSSDYAAIYLSLYFHGACAEAIPTANISGAPCGLNVRKTLIPTDRINLQSQLGKAGASNDGMHYREIMMLT